MKIVIGNKIYSMSHGIELLKTLHGDNYKDLPNAFKHEELKAEWDKYNGVPIKLYQMSQSKDTETLQLCLKLLDQEGIKSYKDYKNVWRQGNVSEELYKIILFLTKDDEKWNNYK